LTATSLRASGPLGIYGIIERVVFEPDRDAPERIQLWGVFAFVDGGIGEAGATTEPTRGYLYLRIPGNRESMLTGDVAATIRTEWRDLESVAGTGEAVAFGAYSYIGAFGGLQTDVTTSNPPYVLANAPGLGILTGLRVRPASAPPSDPAIYNTNVGIVRLDAEGSHREVVAMLRERLDAGR
jgi:hypothetical protein